MGAIEAISEIARGLGDTDRGLCHRIRLSYFADYLIFDAGFAPNPAEPGRPFRFSLKHSDFDFRRRIAGICKGRDFAVVQWAG